MLRHATTVLLSAFLLFQLQPLIARIILPWFGGSPSVWSSCMVFFQVLLLGGYLYAHVVSAKLGRKAQAIVHTVLLVAACATLPVLPDAAWKPAGDENPALRILALLAMTIGLPYFLLSSTGPLVQRWFSLEAPGRSPYRLYALSNVGSLAALLTFPFVFEPALTSTTMAWTWSGAFVLFALLSAACAWSAARAPAPEAAEDAEPEAPERLGAPRILSWLGLAAVPSVLLLAVTNVLCQDIAVVPFLWVAPLSVYLLTFILCFDSDRWYRRRLFAPLLGVVAPLALVMSYLVETYVQGVWTALGTQITLYSSVLFLAGMVCHGELVRSKPGASRLTLFYLCVSGGGAIGGVFVALVAPFVFTSYVELWIGVAASIVAAAVALWRLPKDRHPVLRWAMPAVMTAGLFGSATLHLLHEDPTVVHASRGFFGRLRVYEKMGFARDEGQPVLLRTRSIAHGHTLHGLQFLDRRAGTPTTYYSTQSGVAAALRHVRAHVMPRRQKEGEPVHIGVVGLGAGTLAAYAFEGDVFRFYEIQPEVIEAAERDFTFLAGARQRGATVQHVLGDARIQMEREEPQRFDLLVVDAFSSDAIPKHLLTQQCAELYWRHLRPDGLLAIHITNRFLDLLPVIRGLADATGKEWLYFTNHDRPAIGMRSAAWVVLTSDATFLAEAKEHAAKKPEGGIVRWTDDFSSLWHVLR